MPNRKGQQKWNATKAPRIDIIDWSDWKILRRIRRPVKESDRWRIRYDKPCISAGDKLKCKLDILKAWIANAYQGRYYTIHSVAEDLWQSGGGIERGSRGGIRDKRHKKLQKRSNGEITVEKLHTRGQGPKKEEEEEWDFVVMGMNYRVPFIRWVRRMETWAEESRSDVNGPTATGRPWPSGWSDLPGTHV